MNPVGAGVGALGDTSDEPMVASHGSGHGGGHGGGGGHGDDEEFEFSEVFIHQVCRVLSLPSRLVFA